MKHGYIRKDFDKNLDWFFLKGRRDNPFDLMGDGSVVILFTPGHTPRHQSVLVRLPKTGSLIFDGDACYTRENMKKDLLPGVMWSASETIRSVDRIRYYRDELGATVLLGHDPAAWQSFTTFPECYE